MRFHKQIYFPESDKQSLVDFTKKVNTKHWRVLAHSLERVREDLTLGSLEKLMIFIKPLKLENKNIFEYYSTNGEIDKICYRINYSQYQDIILVVGRYKELITVYFNETNDEHITLRKELYVTC